MYIGNWFLLLLWSSPLSSCIQFKLSWSLHVTPQRSHIVILYLHILSKINHSFKPNQAPNVTSSVGYIISCMSQPLCKGLCSCTGTQNAKNKNASLELISHHLPWTNSKLNSTWLRKQNRDWIYQASVRQNADIFSVPKILRLHVQPLLSKWHLHETLSSNPHLKNKLFRTILSCFIDWQEQYWKLSDISSTFRNSIIN